MRIREVNVVRGRSYMYVWTPHCSIILFVGYQVFGDIFTLTPPHPTPSRFMGVLWRFRIKSQVLIQILGFVREETKFPCRMPPFPYVTPIIPFLSNLTSYFADNRRSGISLSLFLSLSLSLSLSAEIWNDLYSKWNYSLCRYM